MTANAQSGEFSRKINVKTNDPNTASTELVCKGRVLVPFRTDPTTLNFGKIERDSGPVTKTVMLTRGDGGALTPKLGALESGVTAELREVEAGEKYALDITVSPPWPNDKLRGSIKVETGLEEAPTETVRIFGQVDPRLRTEPKSFVLPTDRDQPADLRVTLVWAGEPGKAVGATANDSGLSARLEEEGGKQIVVLHVPAGYDNKGKTALSVAVTTDDPAVSSLRIPVSASAAAAASAEKGISKPAKLGPAPGKGNAPSTEGGEPQPTTQPAKS